MDESPAGKDPNARAPKTPPMWRLGLPFAMVAIAYLYMALAGAGDRAAEISYSRFRELVADHRVAQIDMSGEGIRGELNEPMRLGGAEKPSRHFRTRVPAVGDPRLLPELEAARVTIDVSAKPGESGVGSWLILFLPWIVLIGVFVWMQRNAARLMSRSLGGGGALGRVMNVPGSDAKVPEVTFADVAGQENAKREVAELVAFLRDPAEFRKLGAEVPRGVLLMGAPGTGKTLLARALAGEAGVPFYSISGSEFIEIFVGMGASRVRRLFEAAKKTAPSILFIDELDSVGRTRGTGLGGGHDEREQTLNQILAEMDGFTGREAVIVLAATNRPDVLDPALLRPGRFDRHVTLDLPDREDRAAILAVHTRKVPLAPDVDLSSVASGTPGFSGAELKNLVNEAAMLAARSGELQVTKERFDEARDKLILGPARSLVIADDERHRLAVHEAGHTIVAHLMPNSDPVYKVSIIPRGRALGGTQQIPELERHTLPEDYLRDRLAIMLGGRVAEKELVGSVSSGADDDIRQATRLARSMVARWGMSDEVGPVDLRESEEHPFLGQTIAQPVHHSEESAAGVDRAVRALLHEAEERALDLIRSRRDAMDRLVAALEREETLSADAVRRCLESEGGTVARLADRVKPSGPRS